MKKCKNCGERYYNYHTCSNGSTHSDDNYLLDSAIIGSSLDTISYDSSPTDTTTDFGGGDFGGGGASSDW